MEDIVISQNILDDFFKKMQESLELNVAIVGAGPSGLVAAHELASQGYKVAVFEAKNEPGGGIWGGGMLFNTIVLQKELESFSKQLGIKYEKVGKYLRVDSVQFASALIYKTSSDGVHIFNNVSVEDLAVVNNKVCGIVLNWTPALKEKMYVDPITVKTDFVIDATGHPASVVKKLADRGMIEKQKEFLMDAERAEKFVVDATNEIFPGLYVCGMAATSVHGGPRMGPIFGGMIRSGLKVSKLISEHLEMKV